MRGMIEYLHPTGEVIWLSLARGGKRNPLLQRQHVLDFLESRERHALSP
jgi:hypothetical protein